MKIKLISCVIACKHCSFIILRLSAECKITCDVCTKAILPLLTMIDMVLNHLMFVLWNKIRENYILEKDVREIWINVFMSAYIVADDVLL